MSLRDALEKRPMLGWGLAALMLIAAAFLIVRGLAGGEQAQLSQVITIRCRETGKEWKLPRGAVEKQLMMRPFPLNPDEGLPNPETGKLTGFPVDDWNRMVSGINAELKSAIESDTSKGTNKQADGSVK